MSKYERKKLAGYSFKLKLVWPTKSGLKNSFRSITAKPNCKIQIYIFAKRKFCIPFSANQWIAPDWLIHIHYILEQMENKTSTKADDDYKYICRLSMSIFFISFTKMYDNVCYICWYNLRTLHPHHIQTKLAWVLGKDKYKGPFINLFGGRCLYLITYAGWEAGRGWSLVCKLTPYLKFYWVKQQVNLPLSVT